MRKLLKVVGVLLVLFVVGVAVMAICIDPIVRRGVEYGATSALKVPTRLEEATVKFSGKARLDRFEVDNPAGFKEPKAIVFERLDLTLRPKGLFDPAVYVDELRIVKPEVTLEFTGTKSNLSTLLENLSAGKPAGEQKEGKKFLIRKLKIESGTVKFRSDLLSENARTLTLPSIELDNIGTAEGGASTTEVLKVLLQTLATAAMNAGEGVLPKELLNSLRGDLSKQLQSAPEEIRRKLGDLKVPEQAEPEKVEKTLRDLFDKKVH
ncbi:MAG: hypothetical protein EHM91_02765 [Planctomycetota bacterium]|nr:MAG: hypothetical protein EHM91_02765 [Planctomycetota bacterium]